MNKLSRFPKGLWYESPRRRYRVRRYHNKIVYGPFYFRGLEDALAKLDEVNEELALIPKERRGQTPTTEGAI
jgi:hypothetical protein